MKTFAKVFNFKTVKAASFPKLIEQADIPAEDVAKMFDKVVEGEGDAAKVVGYKRKPETVSLPEPDWLASIPVAGANLIREGIASFAKLTYIDNFLPVAPFTWEDVEKALSVDGRAARKLDFGEDVLKAAAASMARYLVGATNNKKVADRVAEAMLGKFSINSIQKHLNSADVETMEKLKNRLNLWAEWAAENDADNADDFASVYEYLTGRLEKNIQKLSDDTVAILDVL